MSAKFPAAIATDADLTRQKDRAQSTLTAPLNDSDESFTVVSGSKFRADQVVTIENEQILISSVVGNTINCVGGRGFLETDPASHVSGSLVSGNIVAANHNALADEIKAIETALGVNMANVPTPPNPLPVNMGGTGVQTLTGVPVGAGTAAVSAVAAASEGQIFRRKYNAGSSPVYEFASPITLNSGDFVFAAQTPGGSLSVGSNTITLSPVPPGVNGTNKNHYLYISGGVGTAEAALITGGTAVSGAASGTVIVTCANTHTGAWTIQSASSGIVEAMWALPANGGRVEMPAGDLPIYKTIVLGDAILDPDRLAETPSKNYWRASTRNGIELFGQGQGTGNNTGYPIAGTSLRYYGPANEDAMRLDGPIQYLRLHDFHIEGAPNGLGAAGAGIGINMIHAYVSDIRRITVAGTSQWGFVFTSRNMTDLFAAGAGDTNLDTLVCERTKTTSGGILLGPDTFKTAADPSLPETATTAPKAYMDVARVNLHNCYFLVGSGGVGVQIRFVDSSSLQQTIAFGGTYGLQIDEVLGAANNYPDALTFRDCYFSGTTADTNIPANWHSTVAGSVNGGAFFSPWPMEMGAPPSSAGALGYTSTNQHLSFGLYKRNVAIANGDNNNLDLGGNSSSARLSGATGPAAITGLKHGRAGRIVTLLYNIVGPLTIKNQSASSDAGNRIATPSGTDWVSIGGVGAIVLQWDSTDNCWFLLDAATNSVGPQNYIASETGVNNAIAGALSGVTLAAGLRVTVKLAHTLQAGANTFDFNGGGAVAIKSSRNVANNIGTAYAATGTITLQYDGTQWVDVSQ